MLKLKRIVFSVSVGILLAGCVTDGEVSKVRKSYYEPRIMEREGLALARIVTSPYSIVGFTYADCKRCGNWWPVVLPFDLFKTVPAGCFVASIDILVGSVEFLTFQQFKDVSYSWESFDKVKSDKYGNPIVEFYANVVLAAIEGLANADYSSSNNSNLPKDTSSFSNKTQSNPNSSPRVRHSSCRGTGRCNICKGKGYVGSIRTLQDQNRLRCRGCGGSGSCSACGGSGYSN